MTERPQTSSSLTTKARRKLASIAEAARMESAKCSRVLAKLGVRDRAGLVVVAYETGLVRPGTPPR